MDYSRFRSLELKEISELHEKALAGDPEAIEGFVCFAVWERLIKIGNSKKVGYNELVELHENLMDMVKITVKENG